MESFRLCLFLVNLLLKLPVHAFPLSGLSSLDELVFLSGVVGLGCASIL